MISFDYILFGAFFVLLVLFGLILWHGAEKFFLRFAIFADLINNKEKIIQMLSLTNILMLVCVSFLRFFFIVVITLLSYYEFGIEAPLQAIAFGTAVAQIVSFIPITINGLGIREASFSGIMATNGVPLFASIGVVSISLIVNYGLAMLVILAWNICPFLFKKKK
jgi:uncharacterized membrane protein YbhN (UPF0104 family)